MNTGSYLFVQVNYRYNVIRSKVLRHFLRGPVELRWKCVCHFRYNVIRYKVKMVITNAMAVSPSENFRYNFYFKRNPSRRSLI